MTYPAAANAVLTAVYSRLSGDATLTTTLGAGVYDEVPQPTSFPYVAIADDITEVPFDAFGSQGRAMILTIHAWSQKQGAQQCEQIMSRIIVLLDRYTLSVSGGVLTRCVFESKRLMRDPDGRTRHGVVTFLVEVGES